MRDSVVFLFWQELPSRKHGGTAYLGKPGSCNLTSLKTNKPGKWELLSLWEDLVASLEDWTQRNDHPICINSHQGQISSCYPISLQQLEKHTEGSVFWRAGQSLVMLFFPPSSLQWDYNGSCCPPLFWRSLIDNNTLGDVTVLALGIVTSPSAKGALGPSSHPFLQVL